MLQNKNYFCCRHFDVKSYIYWPIIKIRTDEGLQNLGLCSALMQGFWAGRGSLSHHSSKCCETEPRFFRSHSKDRPILLRQKGIRVEIPVLTGFCTGHFSSVFVYYSAELQYSATFEGGGGGGLSSRNVINFVFGTWWTRVRHASI
jgi:hypothetical protein